jgi:hypothetical protein
VGHPSGCACVHSHHSLHGSSTTQVEAPPASTTTTQSSRHSTTARGGGARRSDEVVSAWSFNVSYRAVSIYTLGTPPEQASPGP